MTEAVKFFARGDSERIFNDRIRVTSSGPFIKNDFTRFADKVLNYPKEKFSPTSYQNYLDFYYKIILESFEVKNPFDTTIDQTLKKFSKRPLWAQTFTEKRFLKSIERPDNFIEHQLVDWDIDHWWAERELLLDHNKAEVLIERVNGAGTALTDLSVLTSTETQGLFNFRTERRVSMRSFKSSSVRTVHIDGGLAQFLNTEIQLSNYFYFRS